MRHDPRPYVRIERAAPHYMLNSVPFQNSSREESTLETNSQVAEIYCFRCSMPISFDPAIVGRSGKCIPLDFEDHRPHRCMLYRKEENVSR